jgi:hypothetical protein
MEGLPLAATAAAFRSPEGRASLAVIVETPGGGIAATEQNGRFAGAVELSAVAIDGRNTMAASESGRIDFQLSADGAGRLARDGFRTVTRLDNLAPCTYQVRFAIATPGSPRPGSVWYDVEVPDFSKGPISMSGLVVSSLEHAATPTGNPAKLFDGVLPAPPTATRRFTRDDELSVLAEIYASRTSAPETAITVAITNEGGEVVYERAESADAGTFSGEGLHRSVSAIPLTDLTPGSYVLTVTATPAGDASKAIQRALPLQIE